MLTTAAQPVPLDWMTALTTLVSPVVVLQLPAPAKGAEREGADEAVADQDTVLCSEALESEQAAAEAGAEELAAEVAATVASSASTG